MSKREKRDVIVIVLGSTFLFLFLVVVLMRGLFATEGKMESTASSETESIIQSIESGVLDDRSISDEPETEKKKTDESSVFDQAAASDETDDTIQTTESSARNEAEFENGLKEKVPYPGLEEKWIPYTSLGMPRCHYDSSHLRIYYFIDGEDLIFIASLQDGIVMQCEDLRENPRSAAGILSRIKNDPE